MAKKTTKKAAIKKADTEAVVPPTLGEIALELRKVAVPPKYKDRLHSLILRVNKFAERVEHAYEMEAKAAEREEKRAKKQQNRAEKLLERIRVAQEKLDEMGITSDDLQAEAK